LLRNFRGDRDSGAKLEQRKHFTLYFILRKSDGMNNDQADEFMN